ncbi:HalOD1 output domain-containing protein [Halococcoides cellulosivorans]|uniref:Halobacterial output domain-containing protein n=1 Tax=Halococcoides cellulosivorans TaxID=1679096 RepID=A0A2R4X3K1_9EURY|nr:HalOD1 output domain-containing protein [Halococcoides cellulosivorans]AWB28367.1 hypothetical protein HARCEL1_11940 [Halococcoides cellulosivorans]
MDTEIDPDEQVSTAVVRAVSAVEGRDPTIMRPLRDVLDMDALNALFADRADGSPRTGGRLTFEYSDSTVTVQNGEYLTVELREN